MALAKLIAFDRPLIGAVLPGRGGRTFTEAEMSAQAEQAYRKGVDTTREMMDQKMVEMRVDMEQLSDGVLRKLTEVEPALVAQLREALPALAVDIAKRLLAGYEPPADVVEKLCHEALQQLFPERDGLEISLCPRDARGTQHRKHQHREDRLLHGSSWKMNGNATTVQNPGQPKFPTA